MGDYFPTRVFIGGELKRGDDLSEFLGLMGEWADGYGRTQDDVRYLEKLTTDRERLELSDDQARPDQPERITIWCQEHNLTYWVAVDGKYEYDGKVFFWQPGMATEVRFAATQSGDPTLTYDDLKSRLDAGKTLAEVVAELEPAAWSEDKIPPLILVGAYDPEYDG